MSKQQGSEKGHSVTRGIIPEKHNCGKIDKHVDFTMEKNLLQIKSQIFDENI